MERPALVSERRERPHKPGYIVFASAAVKALSAPDIQGVTSYDVYFEGARRAPLNNFVVRPCEAASQNEERNHGAEE